MILMYHKVDHVTPTIWWVSRETFAAQMKALSEFDVVYLADYNPNNPRHCVITFDDCYENVYRHAFPILKRLNYPFELFINGNLLGKWNNFDLAKEPATKICDISQIQDMANNGARVQWHTASHRDLASVRLPTAVLQMVVPKKFRCLFPPPNLIWLSYPYGSTTPEVVALARGLFQGAVVVGDGSSTDRHQLERVIAHEKLSTDFFHFRSIVRQADSNNMGTWISSDFNKSFLFIPNCEKKEAFESKNISDYTKSDVIIHSVLESAINRYRRSEERYKQTEIEHREIQKRVECRIVYLAKILLKKIINLFTIKIN